MNTSIKFRQWEKKYQIQLKYESVERDVEEQFEYLYKEDGWSADQVTSFLLDGVYCCGAFLCMWFIAIAKKEIELGVLEERVREKADYYITQYNKNIYDNELFDEEKIMMDKAIKYITSKIA